MERNRLVEESKQLLTQLLETINREQEAIIDSDNERLSSISVEKAQTLEKLALNESALISILDAASKDELSHGPLAEIKELLQACKDRNQENRHLTNQGIKILDKSIGFLESLMHIGTVEIYGPEGQTDNRSQKRDLGTA